MDKEVILFVYITVWFLNFIPAFNYRFCCSCILTEKMSAFNKRGFRL